MTSITYSTDLTSKLSESFLFVDTSSLIAASNYPDFFNLFSDINQQGCTLLTIPSVLFEFTRGSDSRHTFNSRTEFINNLADIYPIEKHLAKLEQETILIQKVSSTASYTDFLLVMCLVKFPEAFLITENHKDMPLAILDRKRIITIDTTKQIRNQAIYQLNQTKYRRQLHKLT